MDRGAWRAPAHGRLHGQRHLAGSSPWGRRVENGWAHTHTRYSKASTDSVISQNQMRLYTEKCFANSKVCINIKGFLKRKFRGSRCQISALGLKVQRASPAPWPPRDAPTLLGSHLREIISEPTHHGNSSCFTWTPPSEVKGELFPGSLECGDNRQNRIQEWETKFLPKKRIKLQTPRRCWQKREGLSRNQAPNTEVQPQTEGKRSWINQRKILPFLIRHRTILDSRQSPSRIRCCRRQLSATPHPTRILRACQGPEKWKAAARQGAGWLILIATLIKDDWQVLTALGQSQVISSAPLFYPVWHLS